MIVEDLLEKGGGKSSKAMTGIAMTGILLIIGDLLVKAGGKSSDGHPRKAMSCCDDS